MYKIVCFLLAFVVIAVVAQKRDPRCSKHRPPGIRARSGNTQIYYYFGEAEETMCRQLFINASFIDEPEFANNFRTLRECEDKCNPDLKLAVKGGTPDEQCFQNEWMSGPEVREREKGIYYYKVVDGYSACERIMTKRSCNPEKDNCFLIRNSCLTTCRPDS